MRDRSMNPVITKMEHFVIIVNGFQPFAIVAETGSTSALQTIYFVGSKVWVSFTQITFQPLHKEIAKYYCIVSSSYYMFYLVHNKVHNEAKTCTTTLTRCTKWQGIQHSPKFSLTNIDFCVPENPVFQLWIYWQGVP